MMSASLRKCSSEELDGDGVWTRLEAPAGERHSVQEELRARHSARAGEQFAAAPG